MAQTLIFMYATRPPWRYTSPMPRRRHFYGQNHYHYLTESTYRRARIFDAERCKHKFVQTLDELRSELAFKIFGDVLMPGHGHLRIGPSPAANPSQIMQKPSDWQPITDDRHPITDIRTHDRPD